LANNSSAGDVPFLRMRPKSFISIGAGQRLVRSVMKTEAGAQFQRKLYAVDLELVLARNFCQNSYKNKIPIRINENFVKTMTSVEFYGVDFRSEV
jgi:hypothetical protein